MRAVKLELKEFGFDDSIYDLYRDIRDFVIELGEHLERGKYTSIYVIELINDKNKMDFLKTFDVNGVLKDTGFYKKKEIEYRKKFLNEVKDITIKTYPNIDKKSVSGIINYYISKDIFAFFSYGYAESIEQIIRDGDIVYDKDLKNKFYSELDELEYIEIDRTFDESRFSNILNEEIDFDNILKSKNPALVIADFIKRLADIEYKRRIYSIFNDTQRAIKSKGNVPFYFVEEFIKRFNSAIFAKKYFYNRDLFCLEAPNPLVKDRYPCTIKGERIIYKDIKALIRYEAITEKEYIAIFKLSSGKYLKIHCNHDRREYTHEYSSKFIYNDYEYDFSDEDSIRLFKMVNYGGVKFVETHNDFNYLKHTYVDFLQNKFDQDFIKYYRAAKDFYPAAPTGYKKKKTK